MKLLAEISGQEHKLNVTREASRVMAEINGRQLELEAHTPQAGVYSLLLQGRVYQCRVERAADGRDSFEVAIGNSSYTVNLSDTKRLRSASQAGAHADKTAQILAPMPGKVVRILVEEGASVEAGDGIIVVEAMKMQNEMKSPKAGKVTSIKTSAGATVNSGDVLAIVE